MDEKVIEDLIQTLELINERFEVMGERVDNASGSITKHERDLARAERKRLKAEEDLYKERDAILQKEKDELEKRRQAISGAIKATFAFTKSITANAGSFGPLTTIVNITTKAIGGLASMVPFFGTALKGLSEGVGEALNLMIDTFQRAYDNFEKLTDTGVVESFRDMNTSSQTLGLTFADLEKTLTKGSKDLAVFGGSAVSGRQMLERVGLESTELRRTFQRLGIGAADFNEYQISYIAQQTRYTRGQQKSVIDLAEGSAQYIKELDALSKLTGASKKVLQQEQEARLRDVRYRAGIASLDEPIRKEIDQMLTVLKQVAPGVEEGMKDLIASGGVPTTEAAKATMLALQQGGLNVQEMVRDLRKGGIQGMDAFQKIAKAAGTAANKTEHLSRLQGDNLILTKLFVDMRELEARGINMNSEEYKKLKDKAEAVRKGMDSQNASLADTKTSMYNAARNIDLLATSSDIATKAMSFMAQGLEFMTEKAYEMAGKELPAHLQARKEERIALEEAAKLRKKSNEADAAATKIAAVRENYLKSVQEQDKKQLAIEELSRQIDQETNVEKRKQLMQQRDVAKQEWAVLQTKNSAARQELNKYGSTIANSAKFKEEAEKAEQAAKLATRRRQQEEKNAGVTSIEGMQALSRGSRPGEPEVPAEIKAATEALERAEKLESAYDTELNRVREAYVKRVEESAAYKGHNDRIAALQQELKNERDGEKRTEIIRELKQKIEAIGIERDALKKTEDDESVKKANKDLESARKARTDALANLNKAKQAQRERDAAATIAASQSGAGAAPGGAGSAAPAAPGGSGSAAPGAPGAPGGSGSAAVPSSGGTPPGDPSRPVSSSARANQPGFNDILTGDGGAEQARKNALKIKSAETVAGGPITQKTLETALSLQGMPEFWMFTGLNDTWHQTPSNGTMNSWHRRGRGIDFVVDKNQVDTLEKANKLKASFAALPHVNKALNEYYSQAAGGDATSKTTGGHFHLDIKARYGGVFNGPEGGYKAQPNGIEYHSRELAQPLSANSILEKLATTPATEFLSQMSNSSTNNQEAELLTRIIDIMDRKYDNIISLLTTSNKYSRDIANNI